ncbi:hypothetical protein C9374_011016 [Naegleria lovaniensis]|uniref:PPPDE domain-containing protein n=1 Tax=Naegleria lovaniensis TaxID=51637 RepID=A0AA88KF21_NAELO|nr:uncharacterized protein C9374_011016 [Naegleria lovaniensis]KAG2374179.1 hypothetical protein C9374_011016 [Naegleria lovaniensis]
MGSNISKQPFASVSSGNPVTPTPTPTTTDTTTISQEPLTTTKPTTSTTPTTPTKQNLAQDTDYVTHIEEQLQIHPEKFGVKLEDLDQVMENVKQVLSTKEMDKVSILLDSCLDYETPDDERDVLMKPIAKLLPNIPVLVLLSCRAFEKICDDPCYIINTAGAGGHHDPLTPDKVCFLVFYIHKFKLFKRTDEQFLNMMKQIQQHEINGKKLIHFLSGNKTTTNHDSVNIQRIIPEDICEQLKEFCPDTTTTTNSDQATSSTITPTHTNLMHSAANIQSISSGSSSNGSQGPMKGLDQITDPLEQVMFAMIGNQLNDETMKKIANQAYVSFFKWWQQRASSIPLSLVLSYMKSPNNLSLDNGFHVVKTKVMNRYRASAEYFESKKKIDEAVLYRKVLNNDSFITFEACNLTFPQRFKFFYFVSSLQKIQQTTNNQMNIKIIITKLADQESEGEAFRRRLMSAFYSSHFGQYHLALLIGNTKIEWCDESIVVATNVLNLQSEKIVFQYTIHTEKDPNEINRLINVASKVVTTWNREKTYSVLRCNCQHFILDVLKQMNIDAAEAVKEHLNRLRWYDQRMIFQKKSFKTLDSNLAHQYFEQYKKERFENSSVFANYEQVFMCPIYLEDELQKVEKFFKDSSIKHIELVNRLELDCLFYILKTANLVVENENNIDFKLLKAFDRTFCIEKLEFIQVPLSLKSFISEKKLAFTGETGKKILTEIDKSDKFSSTHCEFMLKFMMNEKFSTTNREDFMKVKTQIIKCWIKHKTKSRDDFIWNLSVGGQTSVDKITWSCEQVISELKECQYTYSE